MKKLISMFLVFILFIAMFSFSCFAENPVQLKLNSETDSVYAGDEFVVRLMISDNSKMSGAAIDVNYDKKKLEYISGSFGGILDESATKSLKDIKGDASKVRFTYLAPSSTVTSQGILVVLKFRALENATGTTELSISVPTPGDFVSQDLTRLSYTIENAKIKILNSIDETESVSEVESESQITETTIKVESTTNPSENKNEENNDKNKMPVILLVSGIAIIFVVFALSNKSDKKKSKRKKKKGRK